MYKYIQWLLIIFVRHTLFLKTMCVPAEATAVRVFIHTLKVLHYNISDLLILSNFKTWCAMESKICKISKTVKALETSSLYLFMVKIRRRLLHIIVYICAYTGDGSYPYLHPQQCMCLIVPIQTRTVDSIIRKSCPPPSKSWMHIWSASQNLCALNI